MVRTSPHVLICSGGPDIYLQCDIFIKWNLGLFLQLIFHKLDLKIINSEKLSFNKINSPGIYHQNCIGLKYFMITYINIIHSSLERRHYNLFHEVSLDLRMSWLSWGGLSINILYILIYYIYIKNQNFWHSISKDAKVSFSERSVNLGKKWCYQFFLKTSETHYPDALSISTWFLKYLVWKI